MTRRQDTVFSWMLWTGLVSMVVCAGVYVRPNLEASGDNTDVKLVVTAVTLAGLVVGGLIGRWRAKKLD